MCKHKEIEVQSGGKRQKFVYCRGCHAMGPMAATEKEAREKWSLATGGKECHRLKYLQKAKQGISTI